jgi:hypothetical protein
VDHANSTFGVEKTYHPVVPVVPSDETISTRPNHQNQRHCLLRYVQKALAVLLSMLDCQSLEEKVVLKVSKAAIDLDPEEVVAYG